MLDKKRVTNPDFSIELYELCKTFHKLPSEIYAEDANTMELLLIVHNAVNTHEDKDDKKAKREKLKAKRQRGEI